MMTVSLYECYLNCVAGLNWHASLSLKDLFLIQPDNFRIVVGCTLLVMMSQTDCNEINLRSAGSSIW